MKGGILEVLLVSAEGIRHTKLIGKSANYVIIECGTQVHRSKTSAGHHGEVYWNEKFTFEFPSSEWENLTDLKLKIMDEKYFSDGGFVGETIVYLDRIIMKGNDEGIIELIPAPYNVVLEDDTYKGEIKIGIKFISNVRIENCIEGRDHI
ncbi:elicitor-responsive protein 3 [Cornus florida]|uniref:elicitor-responsive protein 3 n=1 Tax=Cornus florida TaxID=4283 RepID=UPI0028988A12|nr:elicitor-responsive protein 3 [Cornus florida]